MCKFASFVLTKDGVFSLPDSESHSKIISHFKLHESGTHGLNIVKVEIVPVAGRDFSEYDSWELIFDKDQFPSWHEAVRSEKRVRAALPAKLRDLEYLYASGTQLAAIPPELVNLETLDASGTQLAAIPPELVNLETLYANKKIKGWPRK